MNKYSLLYERTEKKPFNISAIKQAYFTNGGGGGSTETPDTFWEWFQTLDWDSIFEYLRIGIYAAIDFIRASYPDFYKKYKTSIQAFLRTIEVEEIESDEPPVSSITEDINNILYILIAMMVVLILVTLYK